MKITGWLLLVIGIILGLYALNMDVSVAVSYHGDNSYDLPDRVNNLGLMNDRQNYLIVSGILCVLGVILIISSNSKKVVPVNSMSDLDKLKTLLNTYSFVKKQSLNIETLIKMENISERRKKLGLRIKNDNDPDYIHLYENTSANNIIRLLDIMESTSINTNNMNDNNNVGIAEELTKLKKLLDSGVLTQTEFDNQKKKLLS